MKKLVVASVAVAALLLATASDAQASCFRLGGGCGGCAAPTNCSSCGVVSYAPAVQYQQVWKERDVEVLVCKQVVTPEKRKVMVCQLVMKEVNVPYVECVPVVTQEKRKVMSTQVIAKEVEFTYTECVPVVTAQKRKVIQYDRVASVVECDVPCYSTVMVACCDPCGGVRYTCQRVCTMQKVQRTVYQSVPKEVEVTVNVTSYNMIQKTGKRTVTECVPVQTEVLVNICNYNRVEKVRKAQVCDRVMVEQEVTVNVCRTVTEKQMVKVKYCEMVPVQTSAVAPAPAQVAMPVSTVACNTCAPQCNTGCFSGCNLGGCFSGCRLGGCFSGCRLGGCFGGCR